MQTQQFNPRNILVINFGQLGDVVLSLPALRAIRERFPHAKVTVAVGKSAAEVVELSSCADATLVVDRVALRDGFTPVSLVKIFNLVREVRRRKFDFVIDLHSLSETNVLGFLSGAPKRLFARRHGRSLEYLSNFRPNPPAEKEGHKRHRVDCYLDVLKPLGVEKAERQPRLSTRSADDREVEKILRKAKADAGSPLIGLFPGAGHPSRCWPIERFADLADFLVRNDQVRVVVFYGPEERAAVSQMRRLFPSFAVIVGNLTIAQLAAAQARLAAFVSNDTGPMHIASAVGTPVVLLLDKRAPDTYLPLGDNHRVIYNNIISEITTEEVYEATRAVLAAGRTARLFAS